MQNVRNLGQPKVRSEEERGDRKIPLIVDTMFKLKRPMGAHALRSDQLDAIAY